MEGEDVAVILSASAELLCQEGGATALPPLRAINHSIPLIDEAKIYSWRPSKCPDALKPLWQAKKAEYLASGRWKLASGSNASPMLMIPKPARDDGVLRLRTVVDKREQNANTHKLAAPLPDMDGILSMFPELSDGHEPHFCALYWRVHGRIRIVLDVLRREKFYLGADKMNFFASSMKINKSLLSSFLGAVSFLAPDCEGIRIPMGILVTDASLTGASGYLCQGDNLSMAKVVVFIVESLKRFRPLLYGASFRICTDHKASMSSSSQYITFQALQTH
ncbi:DNA/RNA polymerase [Trametes cingulata]|nr:DNA/RNA polymerase [Trametes cingulata]